jgi:hypothetical protein
MALNSDIWGWIDNFYRDAVFKGDSQRMRLATMHYDAWKQFEHDPAIALSIFDEGMALANALSEPWWWIYYTYWRTEAFVFYIGDLNKGLDNAVRTAVEIRKPEYERFPGIGRVYRVLLDSYVFRDPIGYEDKINETIHTMEHDIPLDLDTRCLLQARRSQMANTLNDYKGAEEKAQVYLSMCQHSAFRLMHAYEILCDLAYRRKDYDLALAYATEMDEQSRRCRKKSGTVVSYEVRATIARICKNEEDALKFYRQKLAHEASLGTKRGSFSYDLMCEFHELAGESDKAWLLRDRQFSEIEGKGFFHGEVWSRILRCRLLGRMGKPLDTELQATYKAVENLLKPASFIKKIKRIEAGDYSEKRDGD